MALSGYMVQKNIDEATLATFSQTLMSGGWQPQGGAGAYNDAHGQTWYYQAFTK